jgi:diamine N-acetyltransferase
MNVSLRPVTRANFSAILRLKLTEIQKEFVAPNVYSIAQSKVEPECVPLAIYKDETLIGFAMYAFDQDDNNYWIYRLMIDLQHQGKGYGRAAVKALVEEIRQLPGCDKIIISAAPENEAALALYRSEGFVDTGTFIDDEVVLCLTLSPSRA